MEIKLTIEDHGCVFFSGTPDEVKAEIERLKTESAEQLGYNIIENESGVDVVYHVRVDHSDMDDASDEEWDAAEDAAESIGSFGEVRFFAPFAAHN